MKIAIVSGDDLLGDDLLGDDLLGDDLLGDEPQRLCAALTARGHEARVWSPGSSAASSPAAALPHVGEWAAALERLWLSDAPDVVHAYGWLGGLAAQLATRREKLPTVQTFLEVAATSRSASGDHRESERERVEPLLARGAAWVTGECAADVDVLARWRHGRARVSILCSGVDVDRYSPVGPAAPRAGLHRILCMAPNLLDCSGVDVAVRALPGVLGAELVVAETAAEYSGRDEARAQLEALAAELGVSDRVRFAGPVGGDDLPSLLRSADVVSCTPRRPPRATPVLQAMASGVAVVALPVGVLADAVVDGVTGQVLSQRSPAALAAALRSLLAQGFYCESMGAAGRSRAVSRFTWDRIALDALHIYSQLVPQHRVLAELQSTGAGAGLR